MSIALSRLANHRIACPTSARPDDVVTDEVVGWLGAMQAQDYGGALWSIGLRMAGTTERHIEQAIAERAIVRTWIMRGTLHLVAARDVRWMLALLAQRVITHSAGRYRQLGLDDATFARSKEIFTGALQGGKQLTRDEMLQVLEEAGIATTGQRGYHFLGRCAQDGLICFGVPRGKQQTFVLLDDWVPQSGGRTRDEALAELTTRYFASHGPATARDLMHWTGLTSAEVKKGLGAAGKDLVKETINDQEYWMPRDLAEPSGIQPVYLLPGFDEYVLGYRDRSAVLDPVNAQRICPGGNGVFNPTIVIDGRVAGTWRRALKKDRVVIEMAPFRPLTSAEYNALGAAADRYGEFLGLPVVIVFGSESKE